MSPVVFLLVSPIGNTYGVESCLALLGAEDGWCIQTSCVVHLVGLTRHTVYAGLLVGDQPLMLPVHGLLAARSIAIDNRLMLSLALGFIRIKDLRRETVLVFVGPSPCLLLLLVLLLQS